MKKSLSLLRLFLFITLFIAGCQPAVQTDYRKTIPEDAGVIVAAKVDRLMEKSGGRWQLLLENTLQGKSGNDLKKIIYPLFEDDQVYGIDLKKSVYFFASITEDIAGGVTAVADYTRLRESFLRMEREGQAGSVSEKNGTCRTLLKNGLFCVFNEHFLFCVAGKDENVLRNYAEKQLFAGSQEQHPQPGYKELFTSGNDLNILLRGNLWSSVVAGYSGPEIDWSSLNVSLGFHFENGKATLEYEYFTTDPQTEEALNRYSAFVRPLTKRFLSRYPSDLLAFLSTNLDGRKLYEQVEKTGGWNQLNLQPEGQKMLQEVLASLDGDISLGVTGMMPMGIPTVLLYAECRNADAIELLKKWGEWQFYQMAELNQTGEHQYEMKVFMLNMTVYFGWKKGMAYLTNSPEYYKQLDKAAPASLDKSPLTAGWGSPAAVWMLNVAELMELPMVQLFVYQRIPPQNMDEFKKMTDRFAHMELLTEKSGKTVWNIYLKDKQENSLPFFIDMGKLITGIF